LPDDLAELVQILDLKDAVHIGHSTGGIGAPGAHSIVAALVRSRYALAEIEAKL
jgi:pimeloyl-ACP methyl ester carboxylesterase